MAQEFITTDMLRMELLRQGAESVSDLAIIDFFQNPQVRELSITEAVRCILQQNGKH